MSLTSETLELLVLDRDAGALSPEAQSLLAAYLREHPAAALEAGRIAQTLDLAKQALAPVQPQKLPAPRFKPARGFRWRWLPSQALLPALRSPAAALVCGLVLGLGLAVFYWRQPNPSESVAFGPSPQIPVSVTTPPAPLDQAKVSFWSARARPRKMEPEAAAPASSGYCLVWDSPFKKPRLKPN